MSAIIEQKKQIVDEIADKFKASKSAVVVDYRGLTVAEVTELRKQLREAGVEFKVYKNSMTRRAAEAAELDGLNESINWSKRNCIFILKMLLHQLKSLTISLKNMKHLKLKQVLLKEMLQQLKKLKHLQNYHHAKAYFLCFLSYYKHQSAILLLLQKQLQIKKKNKARKLILCP